MVGHSPGNKIINLIEEERRRQDKKWGVQDHSQFHWLSILSEEVGEVAKELNEMSGAPFSPGDRKKVVKELVQCAAVCVAWMERLEANNYSYAE